MFWKKKPAQEDRNAAQGEKLSGPKELPLIVQQYLVTNKKMDPELASLFRSVVRKNSEGGTCIRIFDESEVLAKAVQIKNYLSFDEQQDLIIYEGTFDEASKRVELVEKKRVNFEAPIFTEDEVRKQIEALSPENSTIFYYQAKGGTHGGPLGKGAAIIELNPLHASKKGRKYNIYTADVINMQPADKGQKLFDSDKPKEIAKWIKMGLHKRLYSS